MSDNIEINDYLYLDTEFGCFRATSKTINMLYDNEIIMSYSGVSDWVDYITLELLNLYSLSSPYNYALGTHDYHNVFSDTFKKDKDVLIKYVKKIIDTKWGQHLFDMVGKIIEDVTEVSTDD